jgi:hypothetical protein
MQDVSSVELAHPALPVLDIRPLARLLMVALGYIPLLHCALVGACVAAPVVGWWPLWTLSFAPAALLLLPPLMVRLAGGRGEGKYEVGSAVYFRWWFCAQWQVVFNRLPLIEETLRLVPGLYSTWLRLWGARLGSLIYWSPGCVVLDRQLVEIGGHTVLGAGARLHSHVITRDSDGVSRLMLAPIRIGEGALIGGLSVLTAGDEIGAGEMTPATKALPPFSIWRNGKRVRGANG